MNSFFKDMKNKCIVTGVDFEVSEAEQEHIYKLFKSHPILAKEQVILPKVSPYETLRQINSFGNFFNLFKDKSCISDKSLISRYDPTLNYKVCTIDEFYSDSVDNTEQGRSYDFTKSFFEQFDSLLKDIILTPLFFVNCEGSDYVNAAYGVRNSFLCFVIYNSEDCMYCYNINNCNNCVDCVNSLHSQYCYQCNNIKNCYELKYSKHCQNSNNCTFCEDCIGCKDCLFCYGLRNQSYMVNNQKVSKDEFEKTSQKLKLDSRTGVELAKRHFKELIQKSKHKSNTIINSENSSGELLTNCKNVYQGFYCNHAEDCGYLSLSHKCKDYWRGYSEESELGYQAGGYKNSYCIYNTYLDISGSYNLYSFFLANACTHCFGCAGLKKKSYCILNKQYSKTEYFELVPRIIKHMNSTSEWGNFFAPIISPQYYEISFVQEIHSPISATEAKKRGYKLGYVDSEVTQTGRDSFTLPDDINLCLEKEICSEELKCPISKKIFKIQKKEFAFYQKFGIPLPLHHWKYRIQKNLEGVALIP